jgi:hypothetical protein
MMVFPLGARVDLIFHNNKRPVRKCQEQMLLMRIVRANRSCGLIYENALNEKKPGLEAPASLL